MAFLRIAAAGASHCEEGLYGERSCSPLKVMMLRDDVDDQSEEVLYHIIHFHINEGPGKELQNGQLTTRAWCFQEARLARRTVSFMRPGIYWQCRDIEWDAFDEHECALDHRQVNWTNWESNIEEYSSCKLTYESDRLLALEGLANEFSKRWQDAHYFGTLRDGLPRQLLWSTTRPEGMRGLPDLPSWTWAAWPGRKQYLYKRYPIPEDNAGVVARFVRLEQDDRTLTLKGCLVPCTISPTTAKIGDLGNEVTAQNAMKWALEERDYSHRSLYTRYSPEYRLTNITQCQTPAHLLWTLGTTKGTKQPVGMVQLNRRVENSELVFCCLLIARRLPNDPLRKLYNEPDGISDSADTTPEPPDWVGVIEASLGQRTDKQRRL